MQDDGLAAGPYHIPLLLMRKTPLIQAVVTTAGLEGPKILRCSKHALATLNFGHIRIKKFEFNNRPDSPMNV